VRLRTFLVKFWHCNRLRHIAPHTITIRREFCEPSLANITMGLGMTTSTEPVLDLSSSTSTKYPRCLQCRDERTRIHLPTNTPMQFEARRDRNAQRSNCHPVSMSSLALGHTCVRRSFQGPPTAPTNQPTSPPRRKLTISIHPTSSNKVVILALRRSFPCLPRQRISAPHSRDNSVTISAACVSARCRWRKKSDFICRLRVVTLARDQ
jgi:hypothetical protein